ncbi:uncharacterized protein VTP21DRAFT_2708 [Calcarisporiella thermophila]|uniref:uncharacterized protein n=1 Tax=Calcarisporiella thermophila TaxID=911321 RepID=UPI0037426A3C
MNTIMDTYDVVVLDIEGTTTPITFVHDCLFPYVLENIEEFLEKNWGTDELKHYIRLLREQAEKDVEEKMENALPIPLETDTNSAQVKRAVIDCIRWQMSIDRKIGALKSFQGYMWKSAYNSGSLKGVIYNDVVPALEKWREQGKKIYIYSSGSVPAQKLLFGYSDKGDLLHYFSGHYDTSIGLKVERESYEKIAKDIGINPTRILFVSDNIHEIVAANEAGFQTAISDRPGNAPLTEEARQKHRVVTSFLQLF